MKKITLASFLFISGIALTGASCSYKSDTMVENDIKKGNPMMDYDAMNKDAADSTTGKKDATAKAGTYEDFAPAKLAIAKTGKVVLFFKAGWCSTCKQVDGDITTHLDKIPRDVTILKVDYDNSIELKKIYGVTTQHTFVQVDENGKLIKKWLGSPTLSDLASKIQ